MPPTYRFDGRAADLTATVVTPHRYGRAYRLPLAHTTLGCVSQQGPTMQLVPVHRRLPRAGIDPICDADTAFVTISMAVHRPLRYETIVALLDDDRCGISLVAVSGTQQPDAAVDVLETLLDAAVHDGRVGAAIVASVRPADGSEADDDRDIDRWLEMSDLADQRGVELLEWFVIADDVSCPRDRLGEPPRW